VQDAHFATQQDTAAQRNVDKQIAQLQAQTKKATESLERERKAREAADSTLQKLRSELRQAQTQAQTAQTTADSLAKAKKNLEAELKNLAARSPSPTYQTYGNVGASSSSGGRNRLLEELDRNSAEMADQMSAR
jgi:chromosome segregation ATPase